MNHNPTVTSARHLAPTVHTASTNAALGNSLPGIETPANDDNMKASLDIGGLLRVVWRAPLVLGAVLGAVGEPLVRRTSPEVTRVIVRRWIHTILRIVDVEVDLQGSPPSGDGLYVCNHRSYVDILALMSCVPVAFVCKKEVAAWPLVGGVAARMGVVFVDRNNKESRSATLAAVAEAVLDSKPVVAFPEGTTHRGPGMGPTRPGLFRIAEMRDFALFPVVIEYQEPNVAWVGNDTLLRHLAWWLSQPKCHVTVSFGPRVMPQRSAAPLHTQSLVEDWMHTELHRLNQRFDSA